MPRYYFNIMNGRPLVAPRPPASVPVPVAPKPPDSRPVPVPAPPPHRAAPPRLMLRALDLTVEPGRPCDHLTSQVPHLNEISDRYRHLYLE